MSRGTTESRERDLWVFGYGSLMWRPGFDFMERRLATVHGYHRSLCVFSHVHRGTPERPGLVLGLDRGGSCRGVVFRVASQQAARTLSYLRERELVTSVYKEAILELRLQDGGKIAAVAYVADRNHSQYAGRQPRAELLRLVTQGHGQSGSNFGYIKNTQDHLSELGIFDRKLAWLCDQLCPQGS